MSDHKKKGDFHGTSSQEGEVGGNKKAGANPDTNRRTGYKQNAGHGGHK